MKTPEQKKQAEYLRSLRHEKNPDIKFQMMLKHAGGQCESKTPSERCPNRHGQPGITVSGRVILTPSMRPKPRLYCQKCGFDEAKKAIARPIMGTKKAKKTIENQETLI